MQYNPQQLLQSDYFVVKKVLFVHICFLWLEEDNHLGTGKHHYTVIGIAVTSLLINPIGKYAIIVILAQPLLAELWDDPTHIQGISYFLHNSLT